METNKTTNNIRHKRKEIVICAAIKTSDGYVIRCHRHHHGLFVAQDMKKKIDLSSDYQGFVTSKNRYVGRYEAYHLQIAAGIPSASREGYNNGKRLFSEDLY